MNKPPDEKGVDTKFPDLTETPLEELLKKVPPDSPLGKTLQAALDRQHNREDESAGHNSAI